MSTTVGGPEQFRVWSRKMTEKEVPKWVAQAVQKIFVQAGDVLVSGTPVGDADTWQSPPPKGYTGGRAKGGWQPTIGTPADSDIERISPSGSEPISEGRQIAGAIRAGGVAFWTNNTPYILRLAHGWSRQGPDGWVPRGLRKVANQFKRGQR